MVIGITTILSLTVDVILTIFGLALALLVVWQDARHRSNQYFGLCMIVFALYGALSCPFKVAQVYDLDPEILLNLLTTFYIGGLILLLNFVLVFAGVARRTRWIERALSVPTASVVILLTWTGQFYTQFETLSAGGYRYEVSTLARVVGILGAVYLSVIVFLLSRQNTPQSRELILPVIVLALGIFCFVFLVDFRIYEANVIAVTFAVVMLGRLVLKYQVFKPLADLNSALEITNLELAEATRLKSQFLANMSHELRTPLNSILGYTELVNNGTYGSLTDTQRDRLVKVSRNGRRLLNLINDVLDLSRIEAGRLDLRPKRIESVPLLNGLVTEFEPLAANKGLTLVRGYGELPAIHADEARARQILWNLLSNAVKFTERGTVIVRGYYEASQRQVVFSFTDTGPGIDPAQQGNIFEAFHQADDSPFQRHEGTRLGLALARLLVQMHGGRLWFESTLGKGSTFYAGLPAADAPPSTVPVLKPGPRARGPLLLAIDDERESLEVLQGQLEQGGYQVYGACSANEGLRLAHELRPALITLDLRMPDISGQQVLASLRSDPATAQTPVLVVSATDDRRIALAAGANGFMTKPVQVPALLEQVRRLLDAAPAASAGQPDEKQAAEGVDTQKARR